MAFQRYGQHDHAFIADEIADLANLPRVSMGSTCYIIATAEKYMVNSKGQWILQVASTQGGGGGTSSDIDLSKYATIQYSDTKDEETLQNTDEHIAQILEEGNTDFVNALTKHVENIVEDIQPSEPEWGTIGNN